MKKLLLVYLIILVKPSISQIQNIKLVTETNKKEIFEGECFVTTTSLIIGYDNTLNVKFSDDLINDVWKIKNQLINGSNLHHITNIDEVRSESRFINNHYYSSYKLSEIGICPINTALVEIPSFAINLIEVDSSSTDNKILKVESPEMSVRVKNITSTIPDTTYSNEFYKMVGEFTLSEKSVTQKKYIIYDTIDYSITIRGKGSSEMLELDKIKNDGLKVITTSNKSDDTIRFNDLRFIRTFKFKIVPLDSGKYDLSKIFKWNYYSLKDQNSKSIASSQTLEVENKKRRLASQGELAPRNESSIVLAIDISESMSIQDYDSSRLNAITKSLKYFFKHNAYQEIPIVLFAGETFVTTTSEIDNIENVSLKQGTAIGNALWHSIMLLKQSTAHRKTIIIIGDGDNTAGFINSNTTAKIALKNGITINSFGIGNSGKVPFGKDFFGRTRYIEDTYFETSLREVSEITKGMFYRYAEHEEFITRLKGLFNKYYTSK